MPKPQRWWFYFHPGPGLEGKIERYEVEMTDRESAKQALDQHAQYLAAEYDGHARYPSDPGSTPGHYCVVLKRGISLHQNRTWPPGKPRTGLLAILRISQSGPGPH